MAENKLARLPENAIAQRLEPQVLSKADPKPDFLRDARAALNQDGSLRNYVKEARESGMDRQAAIAGLAVRLNARWNGGHAGDAQEVSLFLWDEQDQLGDGIYITSTETGRVVAALTEADIYQPAPVPREDGSMAVPLPRIRPELEAAITCWAFDKTREERIVQALAERAHQTDLLREQGDPRLLVATKAGRRHIVSELGKFDPKVLLRAAGGTSGTFLQLFELRETDPDEPRGRDLVEGTCYSTAVMGIQDQTTVNLRHNRAASLQGALVQGWVREVARQLAEAAHQRGPAPDEIRQIDLTKDHLGGVGFWVSPPEAFRYLRRVDPNLSIMPVAQARVMGVRPNVGVLVVPPEFAVASREMFDRWETHADLKFRLWVDWSKLRLLAFSDLDYQAVLEF